MTDGDGSRQGWLAAVVDAERRGELLTAFDLAERGLAEHPDDIRLRHRAVLALARTGATEEAARRFAAHGLHAVDDEEVAALGARIAKDRALAATGGERRRLASLSSAAYSRIHARTGGYYPAINAATMSLVAGDVTAAHRLARAALAAVDRDDVYFAAATRAEAHLLLGEQDLARAAAGRAAALHAGDHAAVASTRHQLELVCAMTGADPAVLSPLAGPEVVHFCGHRISARFPADAEPRVAAAIDAAVARRPPAFAYGALASGADILWAEALLGHGAELHVVLPFAREEFVAASVAPAGPQWVERFERCLARAAAVTYATDAPAPLEDLLYRYGAELAMGLALLRARYLHAPARQLAVWDGEPAGGEAGTAIDVATWRRRGGEVTLVPPPATAFADGDLRPHPQRSQLRVVRAMLFADVKGFSTLRDGQMPAFNAEVLGALAAVLGRYGAAICHRNTWGDALYVVLDDARTAAACALDLQAAVASADLAAAGLPPSLALRLGAHVGPVLQLEDPVLGEQVFCGTHVTRTARIEPVTPPGAVYITEAFAASLAVRGADELAYDYVGHMPAAKGYGRLRMHRLRRTQSPPARTADA